MIRTMMVEISVSRRDGQVTLAVSARTCWMKVNGLVRAICSSGSERRRALAHNHLRHKPVRTIRLSDTLPNETSDFR